MPRGKKQCPSCDIFVATRVSLCPQCEHVFQKKKVEKPKINKTKILERLLIEPRNNKRAFYSREMKILNDLCEEYSLEFMNVVNLYEKIDTLAYTSNKKFKEALDMKFRAFNYVVDKDRYPEYNLAEFKYSSDRDIPKRIKSLKRFLEDE